MTKQFEIKNDVSEHLANVIISDGVLSVTFIKAHLTLDDIQWVKIVAHDIKQADDKDRQAKAQALQERLDMEAKQKHQQEQERLRLEEDRRLEIQRQKQLNQFSKTMARVSLHFDTTRIIDDVDYLSVNRSTYMMESIKVAQTHQDDIHTLISDYHFTERQAELLNRKSKGNLRLISLADVGSGKVDRPELTLDLLEFIVTLVNQLEASPYFTHLELKSLGTFGIAFHIDNLIHRNAFKSGQCNYSYTRDLRRNPKDFYLPYIPSELYPENGSSLEDLLAGIAMLHDKVMARTIPYANYIPKNLSDNHHVLFEPGSIAISLKGSPIAIVVDIRANDVTIKMGSDHILKSSSFYGFTLSRYYDSTLPKQTLTHAEYDQAIEAALAIQTRFMPLNTFRRYRGVLIGRTAGPALISHTIDEKSEFINVILKNFKDDVTVSPSNRYVVMDEVQYIPVDRIID